MRQDGDSTHNYTKCRVPETLQFLNNPIMGFSRDTDNISAVYISSFRLNIQNLPSIKVAGSAAFEEIIACDY